jgi:hypothetical protein
MKCLENHFGNLIPGLWKKKYTHLLLLLCLLGLAPVCGFTQPDIPMNPDLKSNSENWKMKVKENGMWSKKPILVSFGPLKTLSTETVKSGQISREVNRELFLKNIQKMKSRESSMVLELNGTDTPSIRMLTVQEETTRQKNVVGTLVNVNGEGEESFHVSSWLDEMSLQFQNDSTIWHYSKLDSDSAYGILEKAKDSGLKVFLFWVINRKAVMATAVTLMASVKSGDLNGY